MFSDTYVLKEKANQFLTLVVRGEIDKAYELYVASHMRHHNAYFKGDAESLKKGMKESHLQFPNKSLAIIKVIAENNTVCFFCHVRMQPLDVGVALMHIFRFEDGLIAEMWDMATPVPQNSVNENGMF